MNEREARKIVRTGLKRMGNEYNEVRGYWSKKKYQQELVKALDRFGGYCENCKERLQDIILKFEDHEV